MIVFWLDFPLMHLSPLIKTFSLKYTTEELVIVTERDIPEWRKKMGFFSPDFGNTKLLIAADANQRRSLIEASKDIDSTHIFHGIRNLPNNYLSFKELIKTEARVGLHMEPQILSGSMKSYIRRFVYYILFLKYKNKISFMLALGHQGVEQYEGLGLNKNKIFEFGYFLDKEDDQIYNDIPPEEIKLLYVGELIDRKNVRLLLEALNHIKKIRPDVYTSCNFTIIGEGEEKQNLLNFTIQNSMQEAVSFIDFLSQKDLNELYFKSDILILPSKFDGWGAVVTEALLRGLRVIVSNTCSSSCLINDKFLGQVFISNNAQSLANAIINQYEGCKDTACKKARANLSASFVSSSVGASYLNSIINFLRIDIGTKPLPPWRRNVG